MRIFVSLTLVAVASFTCRARADSGSICGLTVTGGRGLESVDYAYYQVQAFMTEYNDLATRTDLTPDACWDVVREWLRTTPIVTEFGWSTGGAPDAYRAWYEDWYRGTFLNLAPDWRRSRFDDTVDAPRIHEL